MNDKKTDTQPNAHVSEQEQNPKIEAGKAPCHHMGICPPLPKIKDGFPAIVNFPLAGGS